MRVWPRRRHVAQVGSPPLRRVVASLATMSAVVLVLVATMASVDDVQGGAITAGVGGTLCVAGAAWWFRTLLVPGAALLALSSLAPLERHSGTAWAAVSLAALLVLTAELTSWAGELRTLTPSGGEVVRRRVAALAIHQLASVAVAATVLVVARIPAPQATASLLLGTTAAVAAVALALARPEP
ncbi:MAG TPA: hypothetical protein VF855_11550 [Acidimicrobiales bacterium]